MFGFLRQRRRASFLAANPIDDTQWQTAINLPLFIGLSAEERQRLREHAAWFLHTKTLTPLHGLELDAQARVILAAQAVLPIMNLDFDAYDDWSEVVLYPGQFLTRDRYTDHIGVVHEVEQHLAGQARPEGPVLFSWLDVSQSPWLDGWNVVIHELAHKLDMRNGDANGRPPLHAGMDAAVWKSVFSEAYDHLTRLANHELYSPIDLYAAESPAECFAVFSEYFFETPHALVTHYPRVYEQLKLFYRQDPLQRLPLVRYRPAFEPVEFGPVVLPTAVPGGWA
ncbi:hypothetical protein HNQ50_001866 [Silvimonas terrae]|uniref:Zinc-dependent peptidase n=1 Tax=Silvimonas terrae TaxID=300266 RepID=A0A840RFQ3_9NEIS|nr:M90 family metallopeptidase [Silvimonas terrae]MBB5191143.1 hypothetical protein [Silvimonas terrae]